MAQAPGVHLASGMVTTRNIVRFSRLSCLTILLILPAIACLRADVMRAVPEDGWRRTAQGWQQLVGQDGRLLIQAVAAPCPIGPPDSGSRTFPRQPIHPLLLAAVQIGLVFAAYRLL